MADFDLYLRSVELKRERVTDWQAFPFCLPLLQEFEHLALRRPVCFFVGENGSGKSTLIEAIAAAYGLNLEGGSRNFHFATADGDYPLADCLTLVKGPRLARDGFFLRAESFFNLATQIDRIGLPKGYGDRSLHQVSHGESFLAVAVNRFRGHGLYILDEPEAALSPTGQFALLRRIHELVETGASQFIIASHSPLLLAYPGAQIYAFDEQGLRETAYEETQHYQLYKAFLGNRAKLLAEILAPEEEVE